MFDIKELVKDLPEREVRSYLQYILFKIGLLEDTENSKDLKRIYNHILNPVDPKANTFDKGNYKKLHILFGYPYLRGLPEEEFILTFEDNFAIGPIGTLNEESAQKERMDWLKIQLNDDEIENYVENLQWIISQIVSIPENVPITIWVSENAHEQTGLLFVSYLLRGRRNPISIINTTKLYKKLFKVKAKRYVPFSSGMIVPEELKVIYNYSKENEKDLTDTERTHLETKWLNLSENPGTLRLWEQDEVKNVSEDYYDDFIIEKAKKVIGKKKGYIKAARLIGEVYGHIFQYIGDQFLEYRLRKLIDKGIFEYEGSLEAMRCYSIKFR